MKNGFHLFTKYFIFFILGGFVYYSIELAFRGYSHWTMFILGGLCYTLLGLINEILPWDTYIEVQGIIGSIIITSLEFLFGYILNIVLDLHIWDYSNVPGNILGQICLPYSLLWCVLSIVGIVFDDIIRYKYFNEEEPRYESFIKNIVIKGKL